MESPVPFDFKPRTRLVFGVGSIDRLGELTEELGCKRVLIVTDRGIVAAGHVARALKSLETAGIEAFVFEDVRENPTTFDVMACLAVADRAKIDGIVGLGGGSAMDTAKGCNFVLTNGGLMQDYWGIGKAAKPMLPLIAIPTTAGTGSECQSFALIADDVTHQKMACGDPKAAARVAILDPSVTLSQPPGVTACTGIDALAHALETAVTKKRTPISSLYSREAFRLLAGNLATVLSLPADIDARSNMLLGAAYAGTAIENSMLGAAHSAANPLTAHFGTIHGQAVGIMLPHVVRFNAQDAASAAHYREWAIAAGLADGTSTASEAVDSICSTIQEILEIAEIRPATSVEGVSRSHLPTLAAEAAKQWTAGFNPRSVSVPDFEMLYDNALFGEPTALARG